MKLCSLRPFFASADPAVDGNGDSGGIDGGGDGVDGGGDGVDGGGDGDGDSGGIDGGGDGDSGVIGGGGDGDSDNSSFWRGWLALADSGECFGGMEDISVACKTAARVNEYVL